MTHENAPESTQTASQPYPGHSPDRDATGAGEALVQQIAEAIRRTFHNGNISDWVPAAARAVLPLVEAQVAPLRGQIAAIQYERDVACTSIQMDRVAEKKRADVAESALRQVREDLTALADEHHAWMSDRVPANDRDERNQHRGLVAGVRTVLARVGAADTPTDFERAAAARLAETEGIRFCDDAGIITHGPGAGEGWTCTGSVHYGTTLVPCASPIHRVGAADTQPSHDPHARLAPELVNLLDDWDANDEDDNYSKGDAASDLRAALRKACGCERGNLPHDRRCPERLEQSRPAADTQPEGTGEAAQRVREFVIARDAFYGREAGDEDLLDVAPVDDDREARATLLWSDLRTLVNAPAPETYDDRLMADDPTPTAGSNGDTAPESGEGR